MGRLSADNFSGGPLNLINSPSRQTRPFIVSNFLLFKLKERDVRVSSPSPLTTKSISGKVLSRLTPSSSAHSAPPKTIGI